MSQLISMRQRIKAVKTIQKITRAMCLVSMSLHTRMKPQRSTLEVYTKKLTTWLTTIPYNKDTTPWPLETSHNNRQLTIVIGTQKGLCGLLANALLHRTVCYIQESTYRNDLLYVGQSESAYKIIQGLQSYQHIKPFSLTAISSAVHSIMQIILDNKHQYQVVTVLSAQAKSFFSQKAIITNLIPFVFDTISSNNDTIDEAQEDYIYEQPKQDILTSLIIQTLQARIYTIIFESFMAEQAARFIAMDSATRNANNLLVAMRLNYNKLRQAKITKELTDLVGGSY